MRKNDMIQTDRNVSRIWLDDDARAAAEADARERHARNGCDAETRDADNIMAGRIRGMAAERAFNDWARRTFGDDAVTWVDAEGGDKEPWDFEINGVTIDVQARNDAGDYDSYAVLKSKSLVQSKRGGALPDVYVCVVTDDDAREHILWGYVEGDRLHDPQALAGPWYGFPQPTHYVDDESPYFKCLTELKARLDG